MTPMNSRRTDAIYFLGLLVVAGFALLVSTLGGDEDAGSLDDAELPALALPEVEFELPFELPYRFAPLARPAPPRLAIGDDTEVVIRQVRSALLETSARVEVASRRTSDSRDDEGTRVAAVLD